MKILKYILFTLVILFGTLLALELIFRPFCKTGAKGFIERTIIEQGLKRFKGKEEFRIFLFGESTMHGAHLYPNSTIDKWMQLYFDQFLPKEIAENITIINFGRLGEDSEFISQAFIDILPYKPDLAVFYSAHNDFCQLENRNEFFNKSFSDESEEFFRDLIKKSAFLSELNRLSVRWKLIRNKRKDEKKIPPRFREGVRKRYNPETDLLDPFSKEYGLLEENWKKNIRRIIKKANKKSVPVIFFHGIANVKEYKPYESRHSKNLSEEELARWNQLYLQAISALDNFQFQTAIEMLNDSIKIDPTYALAHYKLGQAYEAKAQFREANEHYHLANDFDFFPFRNPTLVNEFYRTLEKENPVNTYFIPTRDIFENNSLNGIIDSALINDGTHPTVKGQAFMAREIVNVIYAKGLLISKRKWNFDDPLTFDALKEKLDLTEDFWYRTYVKLGGYMGRKFEKKIEYTRKALQLNPDSFYAKRQLAWVYWEAGNIQAAIPLYQDLNAREPETMARVFEKYPKIGKLIKVR